MAIVKVKTTKDKINSLNKNVMLENHGVKT